MIGGPPLRLGVYEPLLELASGGMASVYVARRIGAAGFEHIVVLKRVHRHLLDNHEFYDMFRDEARVASLVRHPNVVPVVDVVEENHELFLVMDYVESCALATLRKAASDANRPMPHEIVSRIVCDALAGLHAAHDVLDVRGQPLDVVHRDVSPQNVIVGVDGSSRIIDFGVAKARNRLTETKSGSMKGKYSYMAPEQARGEAIDRRTDVFAAGVVLWEALTDRRLFRGENDLDTLRRIVEAPIVAPSSIDATIPKAVDAVVLKALARDAKERYQSAHEFLDALEKALPPASPRAVARFVEEVAGERLADRRAVLRAMMEGKIPPLSHKAESFDPSDVSSAGESVPQLRPDRTAGKVTVIDTSPGVQPPPSKKRMWIAGAIVGALAIVGLAVLASKKTDPPTVTSKPVAEKIVPTATSVSTDIDLTLIADAPIRSVDVEGLKRVELDGSRAHAWVSKIDAPLVIDATLENGKHAKGSVDPKGSREIHLATVAEPKPSAKPTSKPVVVPARTNELQSNPYGNP